MSEQSPGLVPASAGATLARGTARSGLLQRGRREAAEVSENAEYARGVAFYREREFAAAAAAFLQAAEQGHAESQYLLSTMLEAGQGVALDAQAAALWERKAAEQGHAYAQANLSYRYYEAEDYAEAFGWCQRAAHRQLAWAQYHLGLMHRKGEGTPQSNAEAARWYRLAAEQDFAEAQAKLADLYTFGAGVPQSYEQAAHWYQRAAVNGHADAQYQLAHLYATGLGLEVDYVQSRHWIREAGKQGHPEAVAELKRREYRDA